MPEIALRLVAAEMVTPEIRMMRFESAEGVPLPDWQPGAHVELVLPDGELRPYSLMPTEAGCYRVAVLRERESRGGSIHLHALGIGAGIAAHPPKNDFPLDPGDGPALFVAGGIGITPFPAMLRAKGSGFLFYCGQSRGRMAFADALDREFGGAVRIHADDEAGGLPDLTALMRDHAGGHVYICGPRPMIDAARVAADAAGIAPDRVHVELFAAQEDRAGDTAFEVVLHSTGKSHEVPPGRSIIDVLEAAGHDLMYDCQRGDCGICRTDVIEGVPDHRDVVLSQAEKDGGKVMQICVSRATSPRLVLDL